MPVPFRLPFAQPDDRQPLSNRIGDLVVELNTTHRARRGGRSARACNIADRWG